MHRDLWISIKSYFVFFLADMRHLPPAHIVDAVQKEPKPTKSTNSLANKQKSTVKSVIKAKPAIATKITKLVLKPKPTPKIAPAAKMTTKKYSTKPVTIKSRSTLSTVISHESTFRVRNIKKSSTNTKFGIKESEISVKSEQISHQLTMNTNIIGANQTIATKRSFDMVHNERNANITSVNVNSPILQEITSSVVNGSNLMDKIANDLDADSFVKVKEHENRPPKSILSGENDVNGEKKKIDVNKARKFIRTQKEKWKSAENLEKVKSKPPPTRNEIKERLNALRKSTLNIVAKNVQKARNNSLQHTPSKNITQKNSQNTSTKAVLTGKAIKCFFLFTCSRFLILST